MRFLGIIVLVYCLCGCSQPKESLSEEEAYAGAYRLSSDGRVLEKWTKRNSKKIDMRESKNLSRAEEIGIEAFELHNSLEEIVLSENVKRLGIRAFGSCRYLQKVTPTSAFGNNRIWCIRAVQNVGVGAAAFGAKNHRSSGF